VHTLTVGVDGWAMHEPLRTGGRRSSAVLDRVEAVGADAGIIRSRASCTPAPGSPVWVSDGSPRPTGGHVTFVTVNFGSNNFAFPLTNSERYQTVDDMTANFSGLRYRTSAGWVDWASPIVRCDTDTGYNNTYISPTHVRVASPGTFVQC
jgi:hypothetical protein